MENITLTKLEKEILLDAMSDGFLYDYPNIKEECPFLTYGFEGKRERGAAASLVKKGIVSISSDDEDTYVYSNVNYETLCKLIGIENPTGHYEDVKTGYDLLDK